MELQLLLDFIIIMLILCTVTQDICIIFSVGTNRKRCWVLTWKKAFRKVLNPGMCKVTLSVHQSPFYFFIKVGQKWYLYTFNVSKHNLKNVGRSVCWSVHLSVLQMFVFFSISAVLELKLFEGFLWIIAHINLWFELLLRCNEAPMLINHPFPY